MIDSKRKEDNIMNSNNQSEPEKNLALGCKTDDLLLIHSVLRNVFKKAPDLIINTSTEDEVKLNNVVSHLTEFLEILHQHHAHEDDFYWKLLKERAPHSAKNVDLMQKHHDNITVQMNKVENLIMQWKDQNSDKNELVSSLRHLFLILEEHLDLEEKLIMPLAAKNLTHAEWDKAKEQAIREIPQDRLMFQIGFILECAPSESLKQDFLNELPPPFRTQYNEIGKKLVQDELEKIYG